VTERLPASSSTSGATGLLLDRRKLLGGLVGGTGLLISRGATTEAATTKGALGDLDDDASTWQVWLEPPDAPAGSIEYEAPNNIASPNRSGTALRTGITGGSRPYTNLHIYRKLPPASTATAVELTFLWRFSKTTLNNEGKPSVMQAFEPAISKWARTRRYEWALQWQNVGDGSGDPAPGWRLWTGHNWQSIGYEQRLKPEKWHKLTLRGDIVDGMVHYVEMISNDLEIELGHTFDSVKSEGDGRLIPSFQLDGNYQQDAHWLALDKVTVRWWKTSPWR
jgi:hypothetical protein